MRPEKVIADYEEGILSLGGTLCKLIFSLADSEPQHVFSLASRVGLLDALTGEVHAVREDTTWLSLGSGAVTPMPPGVWNGVKAALDFCAKNHLVEDER